MFKKLSEALLGPKPALEDRMPEEVVIAYKRDDEEVAERDYEEEREYAESREDSREFEEAGREAERTREALEDFRASLDALNVKGGLTQESFQYAVFAAKTFENKLGLENLLDTSSVSFEGLEADARNTVSLEKIDHAIEHLKSVEKVAQEQLISANDRVAKNAASLENLEIVDAVREARGLESYKAKFESIADDCASLEDLRELVVQSNEAGGLSFESLVLLNYSVEQLVVANGVEAPILTDSLESLDREARHQVSLENYDIAMEGIIDLVKKAYDKVAGMAKKAWQKIGNALGVLRQMIPEAIEELTKFKKELESNKDAKIAGKIDGAILKRLHAGGKVPTDLVKYLHDFADFATKFIGTYGIEAQKALHSNLKLIKNELVPYSVESFEDSLVKIASGWKSATEIFPNAKDLTIPGEGNIFDANDDYSDNASSNKAAQSLADTYRYTLAGTMMRSNRKIRNVPDEIDAVSVKDLIELVDAYVKVLKMVDVDKLVISNNTLYDYWAVSAAISGPGSLSGTIRRKLRKEIEILEIAMACSWYAALEFPMSMARSTVRVARSIISLGKASLKTISTESLEEVSMEASVKELKAGAKVKFSHGHGKIKKIFTSEFKIGHKHHKASKDDPRYLVAADKGGHLSIHKASALTLV